MKIDSEIQYTFELVSRLYEGRDTNKNVKKCKLTCRVETNHKERCVKYNHKKVRKRNKEERKNENI